MLCAISGEAPQVPVVSSKSGNVYEKRLIEAYITENALEPTTGETLSLEDLIDLKTQKTVRPRPPQFTSIPSLLGAFQEEWDALALETYKLRQNLAQTRQDLSNALYQHDAAVRVIARLTKERDEAREALASVDVGSQAQTNGDTMHVDPTPLPEAIKTKIANTQESLSKTRRKRPVPEDWATAATISTYSPRLTSQSLTPSGVVLSLHADGDLALIGGTNSAAQVYSVSENKVQRSLQADGGSITGAVWLGDRAAVSSSNGQVLVFAPLGKGDAGKFDAHNGAVSAIALHPSGDILASVGQDGSYVLYDMQTMNVLTQVTTASSLTCVDFHPDGHLLAVCGVDHKARIFEIRSGTQAAVVDLPATIKKFKFSENGTWFACAIEDATSVLVYDIRKIEQGPLATVETGTDVDAVEWDYTGQFLASAGPGGVSVSQYSKASKAWSEILKSADPATGVVWGKSAQSLLTSTGHGAVTLLAA